jgi:hypothetical protein
MGNDFQFLFQVKTIVYCRWGKKNKGEERDKMGERVETWDFGV